MVSATTHRKLEMVGYRICPYAQRLRFALEDNNFNYELRLINPYVTKPQWFRKISPHGKVPILIDGDFSVFESSIILEYLDMILDHKLLPKDPVTRCRHKMLCNLVDSMQLTLREIFTCNEQSAYNTEVDKFSCQLKAIEPELESLLKHFDAPNILQYYFGPLFNLALMIEKLTGISLVPKRTYLENFSRIIFEKPSFQATMDDHYATEVTEFLQSQQSILSAQLPGAKEN